MRDGARPRRRGQLGAGDATPLEPEELAPEQALGAEAFERAPDSAEPAPAPERAPEPTEPAPEPALAPNPPAFLTPAPQEPQPAPVRAREASRRPRGIRRKRSDAEAPSESEEEPLVRVPVEDLAAPSETFELGERPAVVEQEPEPGAEPETEAVPDTSEGLFGLEEPVPIEAVPRPIVAAEWVAGKVNPGQPDPIRFARLHLRTGSLVRARSEYEALAAEELLDLGGTLDLAEVRWRTADLTGAGLAAASYIAAGGEDSLAFLIAAEAAADEERMVDAHGFAVRASDLGAANLQALFAGLPRRMDWPKTVWVVREDETGVTKTAGALEARVEVVEVEARPLETAGPAEPEAGAVEPKTAASEPGAAVEKAVAVEPEVEAIEVEAISIEAETIETSVSERAPSESEPAAGEIVIEIVPAEPEDEAAEPATQLEPEQEAVTAPTPDPWAAEVAAGKDALDSGDALLAALHLAVALRISPEAAGAVLEAIGAHDEIAIELVRADALRMLGDEGRAGQTYDKMASLIGDASKPGNGRAEPSPRARAVPTEPAPAEPAPAEPAPAEPPPAESVPAEPVPAEPAPMESASAEPAPSEADSPSTPPSSDADSPPAIKWE